MSSLNTTWFHKCLAFWHIGTVGRCERCTFYFLCYNTKNKICFKVVAYSFHPADWGNLHLNKIEVHKWPCASLNFFPLNIETYSFEKDTSSMLLLSSWNLHAITLQHWVSLKTRKQVPYSGFHTLVVQSKDAEAIMSLLFVHSKSDGIILIKLKKYIFIYHWVVKITKMSSGRLIDNWHLIVYPTKT